MPGSINSKVALTGILADPKVANEFKDALLVSLKPEAARLEALVKSRTPVYSGKRISPSNPPPGSLRDGVEGKIKPTKKGVAIIVSADKAKRKGTAGDSKRRTEDRVAALDRINARKLARATRKNIPYVPVTIEGIGKAGRRYGLVPYGVFVNNETGFLDDTVLEEQGRTLGAINDAVGAWVAAKNATPNPPKTPPTT